MSEPTNYTYATHLDVKFPALSLVDVPSLVKASPASMMRGLIFTPPVAKTETIHLKVLMSCAKGR